MEDSSFEVNFDDIVAGLFTDDETRRLNDLSTEAEAAAKEQEIENALNEMAAERMATIHPYISQDSALYRHGMILEVAFLKRDELICEPLDTSSPPYVIDGDEWALTDKRRELFDRMCQKIVELIECNPGMKDKATIFDACKRSEQMEIVYALQLNEVTPDQANALNEHAEHLFDILCHSNAGEHFQTA